MVICFSYNAHSNFFSTYMDSMGEAVYFISPNYETLTVGDFNAQEADFPVKDFCNMTVLSISLKNQHAIRILACKSTTNRQQIDISANKSTTQFSNFLCN